MSEHDLDDGPDTLRRELAALWRRTGEVPPELDRAVLDRARAALARRRPRGAPLAPWLAGAAAAAAALVAVTFLLEGGERAARRPLDPRDVDRDGRFDVVDAYVVARAVAGKGGRAPAPEWDFDGDARVDGRDVDLLLDAIVRVGR
jgi:hypothetical protein